jgi:hypothetical protein
MPPTISASVGKKGTNHPDDVRTVQTLLNGFVAAGRMGSLAPLTVNGDPKPTVPYIEKFQKAVAGFSNPDGKIAPGGTTWTKLIETPDGVAEFTAAFTMVHAARARPPVDTIQDDLWQAGLAALISHLGHVKLRKPEIVTFMDFRLGRMEPRLWTVNIRDHKRLHKSHVAHGSGSGSGGKPTSFEDGYYKTSLGAYVTLSVRQSKMGKVAKPEPASFVLGLEPGVNGRAEVRGIAFHAATYVNPPYAVGTSGGCFATPVRENRDLIPLIANGTFAYAFAG